MALNKWIGIGRITKDPELRSTPSGLSVCGFTVAVNGWAGKGGEQDTDFINITAWRSTAEFVCKHFSKGDPIQVVGRIKTRKYTDKDGNERTATEVVADEISFVEGYKRAEKPEGNGGYAGYDDGFMPVEEADDLPF